MLKAPKLKIKPIHPDFIPPKQASSGAAGFDLHMPESGHIGENETAEVNLGFASAIPDGYVGLILPRSGVGFKHRLSLSNTCGVIDKDFRGSWRAKFSTQDGKPFSWEAGERLFQVLIMPIPQMELEITDELDETERGEGGIGSTGS